MTSESEPIRENDQTPDAARKADEQPQKADPPIPDIPAPIQANGQKTPHHCEITYKKEKDWWDKTKPYVEIAGLLFLAVYTGYTIKMYHANRKAANAAESAANTAALTLDENNRQFQNTLEQMKAQTGAQQGAVDVARDTLEITQRAYLILEINDINYESQYVILHMRNIGHIPPVNIRTVVHEATVSRPPGEVNKPAFQPTPIDEMHWTQDVINGQMYETDINIHVRLPRVDEIRLAQNQQKVIIVGKITYNDGFPKTEDQITPFCYQTAIHSQRKIWGTCDWSKEFPISEKTDEYPSDKYHTIN